MINLWKELYPKHIIFQKNGEELKNQPGAILGGRGWSGLARWKFREFNELPHSFHQRLHDSLYHANLYVNSFPSQFSVIIAKFLSLILGSIVFIVIVVGLINEDFLLKVHLFDKSGAWWAAACGIILSVVRGLIPSHQTEKITHDQLMERIVSKTHHFPKEWRGKVHTIAVKTEFEKLYERKVVTFVYEVISVLTTPFILFFSLPQSSQRVVKFFQEFSDSSNNQVGTVCKFGLFPLQQFGNPEYSANASKSDYQTKDGKLEKSFLTFQANHPDWKPNKEGEEYLDTIGNATKIQLRPIKIPIGIEGKEEDGPSTKSSSSQQKLEESQLAVGMLNKHFYNAGNEKAIKMNQFPFSKDFGTESLLFTPAYKK